jgi:hypothetical protein
VPELCPFKAHFFRGDLTRYPEDEWCRPRQPRFSTLPEQAAGDAVKAAREILATPKPTK